MSTQTTFENRIFKETNLFLLPSLTNQRDLDLFPLNYPPSLGYNRDIIRHNE